MPTGYTSDIEKGISFKEFALSCARAFGALIMMRDDPADAEIPDSFKPDSYYKNSLEAYEKELERISNLTEEQVIQEIDREFEKNKKYYLEQLKKKADLKEKYLKMLAEVEAYTPPSPDHENMKKFMRDQIIKSIDFDCDTEYYDRELKELKRSNPEDWRKEQISYLKLDIERSKKSLKEEEDRAASRTLWVRQLKDSLRSYA